MTNGPEPTPPAHHGDWQYGIYLRGLAGETPEHPTALDELERRAAEALQPEPRGYVWGGAGTGETIRANLEAFRRRRLVPRMLRDISRRSLATTVLGTVLPAPVLLAPVGVQTIVHPDGELASARGASALGLPVVASTAADRTLEQIAAAAGDSPRWFQLYWPKDDAITASLVRRAEAAGYSALVVTLDTIELGWRPATWATATSRSSRARGSPSSPRTPCSAPGSRSRRRTTCRPPWATGHRSSTGWSRGTTSPSCAR